MTQAHTLPAQTPASRWSQALQTKLMAAIDAIWAILEHSDDPDEIKEARNRAKAIGDLAAMVRKVAQITPAPRVKATAQDAPSQDLAECVESLEASVRAQPQPQTPAAPVAAQAEHARRALEKLKGGQRGRL